MAISKDLFLSILSMDAYNRGYNAGINGLSELSNGTAKLGPVQVVASLENFDLDEQAEAAGFYAIAYKVRQR